jgi:hypothetical protein
MLAIMAITDTIIGFYQWQMMLAVYGSIILTGIIGMLLAKRRGAGSIFLASSGSSILFFLVTNWAVWAFGTMYPHTMSGLLQSYFMALPFFGNSIVGDVAYSLLLF